ncbi:zinc ribbon domain-containing protein [Cohnella sp.]|uniref:zinc ribbon domain-containing protein n=1 Tax=Cohnella sp. TaxID=1883426 RepID=UPI00356482CA
MIIIATIHSNQVNPENPNRGFVLTKQSKILIGSGLFIILLLAGAYFLGRYLTDEERLIKRFEQSVKEEKSDKLFKLLSSANEDIKFDQKSADGIVAYFKSNSNALIQVTDELELQSKQIRSGEQEAFAEDQDTAFVYLQKRDGKRWLIYNDYELKIKRYMIPVQTNFEGAKILVDGKESATAGGDGSPIELGPFLPGEYSIKAVFEGEYTTLEKLEKVSLFPLSGYDDTVELVLEGDYVNVESNNGSARIYINGQHIGLMVEDGQKIGPISLDGSNKMHLEADYPWGTMVSEELPIDVSELAFVIEGLNDIAKDNIMDSTHEFQDTWMKSLQSMDSNILLYAHPDRIADLTYYIESMKVNGQEYRGRLDKMSFDLDSFVLTPLEDGGYSAQVKAQVDYSDITYYKLDNLNPVPAAGTTFTDYELAYEDGQWIVTNWFESNVIGTKNTKVYK